MSIGFSVVVFLHGLIHLMGFIKAFNLAAIQQLTLDISRPAGLLWLAAAVLFTATATALLLGRSWWWLIAAAALVLSQVLIIMYWRDAKFGSIANAIVLAGVILGYGSWSFGLQAVENRRALLEAASPEGKIISAETVAGLPPVVQTWIGKSGVIGKKSSRIVHLKQQGEMRTKPDGKWMPFTAAQWFTASNPGFVWHADVEAPFGIRLAGLDTYREGKGHMLIKLLSLIPVVDARGDEIDQGAMVRYLAEIIWFPSAALSDYIKWEQVDATAARATMTAGGTSATGTFHFSPRGDVLKFTAKRYYSRNDQTTLEDWIITIDPDSYSSFSGVRIPTRSTVTWKLKDGDFTWLRLRITEIQHNRESESAESGTG
jgi:hypothetical protein